MFYAEEFERKLPKKCQKIEETTNAKSWFSYETKISIDFELKVEKIDIFKLELKQISTRKSEIVEIEAEFDPKLTGIFWKSAYKTGN